MSETLTGLKRTHYCGTLRAENIGETVTVCGWVQKQRDKGGLIFIGLRDRTGILQLTFDETTDRAVFEKAKSCRSEYVLAVVGTVRERSSKNPDIPTGDIEIAVTELRILNKAVTPAFEITDLLLCADFLCASRRMSSGCGGRFGNSGGGLAIFRSVRTAGHSQGQPAWNTSRFLSGFGGYSLLCGGNCADLFGGMVYFENQEA